MPGDITRTQHTERRDPEEHREGLAHPRAEEQSDLHQDARHHTHLLTIAGTTQPSTNTVPMTMTALIGVPITQAPMS